jgi:hypothetical protein
MANSVGRALGALAQPQHGVFTTGQARSVGVSRQSLYTRVRSGELIREAPETYRFANVPRTWHTKVSAAVYTTGEKSAASHLTAAHLHDLMKRPDRIEVVTTRTGRKRPFVVHQSLDLETSHITVVDGIPVTSIPRTIIDIGVPHGIGATARCLDEARRRELVDLVEVAALLHSVARRGRNGVGPARRILEERLQWDQITDSQLEDRFLRVLQTSALPRPVGQHVVESDDGTFVARVDFAYPDHKIAIELDGAAYHSDPTTFRYDRQRQNRLVLNGWTVLRFTYWDVFAGGDWVADSVAAALPQA